MAWFSNEVLRRRESVLCVCECGVVLCLSEVQRGMEEGEGVRSDHDDSTVEGGCI